DDVLLDRAGRRPVGRERVPVRNEEEAAPLVLEPEPVLERAVIVSEVLSSGRARAAHDDLLPHRHRAIRRKNAITGPPRRPRRSPFITTRRTMTSPIASTRPSARATAG